MIFLYMLGGSVISLANMTIKVSDSHNSSKFIEFDKCTQALDSFLKIGSVF